MKLIPIDTSKKAHNPTGAKATPPKVSINVTTFTLNNNAILELSKIWGSLDFSLQLFVSECGDYIGIGARESITEKTGLPKSISSREAKDRLNLQPVFGRHEILLTIDDGVLVGKVN